MFRMHGMKLDALKRPSAFSTPMPNAAPHMNTMYGRRVRTSRSVRSKRAASASPSESRNADRTPSAPNDSATMAHSISSTIVITLRASFVALSSSPPSASTTPLKTGTNAAVNAPSPKSFRVAFGMAKASVNALCSMPAPIRRDWNISRTRPSTRESDVNAPTIIDERSIDGSFAFVAIILSFAYFAIAFSICHLPFIDAAIKYVDCPLPRTKFTKSTK